MYTLKLLWLLKMKDMLEISGIAHQFDGPGQIQMYQPTPAEFQSIQN